jgi:twitching motility protein PilT
MIREEKSHQIKTAMQTGVEHSMQTLNQSLLMLVQDGTISIDTAYQYSEDKMGMSEDLSQFRTE